MIGVLPAAFRFPNVNPWGAAEMETSAQPAVFVPKVFRSWEGETLMGGLNFAAIGRLKSGVTCEQVTAELNVIGARIVDLAGTKGIELRAIVEPLKEALVHDSRRGLLVVLGAVGALLLIACLNLGILGLVRAERRDLESAVRAAPEPAGPNCCGRRSRRPFSSRFQEPSSAWRSHSWVWTC